MQVAPLGEQLREWRTRRRMSQMDLALDTEMSTRHLSFIETGRSKPTAAKGVYIRNVSVSSTMGPGIVVDATPYR